MKIAPYIPSYNYTPQKKVNFEAHPDEALLKDKYPNHYNVSCYFRHGNGVYALPADEYKHIVEHFEEIFSDTQAKKKMLIGGVADSQEPFSYLATIKSVTQEPLDEVLDLNIVDIKDKPDDKLLFRQSFYSGAGKPLFSKDSFLETRKYRKLFGLNPKYRVDNDIYNYLKTTYSNPENSKWETRIQDAVEEYPNENFDIISINNVIQYIADKEAAKSTLQNVVRILKPGGIFITDSFDTTREVLLETEQMECLSSGIYRKKSSGID